MAKIIILLIMLNIISYSELFSSETQYLRENTSLDIEFFTENEKNVCKYKIDKFNNLMYSKNEENEEKIFVKNDVYSYNEIAYRSAQAQEYKFWEDKKLDLRNEGLYINDELAIKSNNSEEVYLVEYFIREEVIRIPLILKKNYIVNGMNDSKKITILSEEKILKEIQYFRLYEFIDYLNKIKRCY